MKYMGSKNRIAKHIVPIIQSYIDDNQVQHYIEPFVGGVI
jgi:DNA adenine methylase